MAAADKLAQLKQLAQNDLATAQSEVTAKQSVVDLVASFDSDNQTERASELAQSKADGIQEGLAQGGKTPDDGLYSEAEVVARVSAATEPLNTQIASLSSANAGMMAQMGAMQEQVSSLQAQISSQASSQGQAVLAALSQFKIQVASDIEDTEKDNMALAARYRAEATPVVAADPVASPVPETEAPASLRKGK